MGSLRYYIGAWTRRQTRPQRESETETRTSRWGLIAGGASLLGAAAGGTLLQKGTAAEAAVPGKAGATAARSVTSTQFRNPTMLGVQATLPVHLSGHHQWARYEWSLAGHFCGAQPPVVVASVLAAHYDISEAAPTCLVSSHGTPGAYHAVITVYGVSTSATEVTVNAVALGE